MKNKEQYMSEKLRGLRAEKKLTCENVADKLGIHRETFRKYENEPFMMDVKVLLKILSIYDVNPAIFFNQLYGKMPKETQKEVN